MLPAWREVALTSAFFLAVTVVFLWFAVSPLEFGSRLQTRDSVLIFIIQAHTTGSIFGGNEFWNFPIFYPLPDMLCLSEPMLLPAVLFAPLYYLFGYPFAGNLYIYFCWFTSAMGCWLYLRHRGVSWIPCAWASFFVAFSPAMAWHAAGHAHLYFQAGFPLALLAFERGLHPSSSRVWGALFGVFCLAQALAGFYVLVFFSLWLALVLPLVALSMLWRRTDWWSALSRQAVPALVPVLLALAIILPIARHYSEFGKSFPGHSLDLMKRGAANWSAYLLPPADPSRILTPSGRVYASIWGHAPRGENTRYIGFVAMFLVVAGLATYARPLVRRKYSWKETSYPLAFVVAGLGGLIFSFGPYIELSEESRIYLPHGLLYAYVEQVRFIRAVSRFGIILMWALAILGALVMQRLLDRARGRWGARGPMVLGVALIAVNMIDFLPTTRIFRIRAEKSEFAEYLATRGERAPFIELPLTQNEFMVRFGWHFNPMANGYSGYYPPGRLQELLHVEREFPGDAALAQLEQWGVEQVFLTRLYDEAARRRIVGSGRFDKVWEGEEGVLLQLPRNLPTTLDIRNDLRMENEGAVRPIRMWLIRNGEIEPDLARSGIWFGLGDLERDETGGFVAREPISPFVIHMNHLALDASLFHRLVVRARVTNWYRLNENLNLYWTADNVPTHNEAHRLTLLIPGDGEFHDYEFTLDEHLHWLTSGPVRSIRLDFGARIGNRITIEELHLTAWVPAELLH